MPQVMTRASLDKRLVARCRDFMTRARMDVSETTPNLSLDDPLVAALTELGLPPHDPATVVDLDLARLTPILGERLLDLTEIRVLDRIMAWLASRPSSQMFFNQYQVNYQDQLLALGGYIEEKWKAYRARWVNQGGSVSGKMTQSFCQRPPTRRQFPW